MTVAELRSYLDRFPEDEQVRILAYDYEYTVKKIVYEVEPGDEGRVNLYCE